MTEVYTGTDSDTITTVNADTFQIDLSSMDTTVFATHAYDTGIQIDLQNDGGVEYWFDFEHISVTDDTYYYYLPSIVDKTTIGNMVAWGTTSSIKKFSAHIQINGRWYISQH